MNSHVKNSIIDGLKSRSLGYLQVQRESWVQSLLVRISTYQFALSEKCPQPILTIKMMMVDDAIDWIGIYDDAIEDCEGKK